MFLLPTPYNADLALQGKHLSGYLIPPFRRQQQKILYSLCRSSYTNLLGKQLNTMIIKKTPRHIPTPFVPNCSDKYYQTNYSQGPMYSVTSFFKQEKIKVWNMQDE